MTQDRLKQLLFIGDKLISKRCTQQYFQRNNCFDLYKLIQIDPKYTLAEHVYIHLQNVVPQKCKCGAYSNIADRCVVSKGVVFSGYCSKECAKNDASNIMKKAALNRDETASQLKREETNLKKTGFKYNSQRPEIKEKLRAPKIDYDKFNLLMDKEWLLNQYQTLNKPSTLIADEMSVYYGTVLWYLYKHNIPLNTSFHRSGVELRLAKIISDVYGGEVEFSNRTIISPREIDIYIPEHNLGIEVNGLYYHSSPIKETNVGIEYHAKKTEDAYKAGVTLLQFTDQEIISKQPIVKSMIANRLNKSAKIFARKCVVKLVTNPTLTSSFFQDNHISGHAPAKIYVGLFDEDGMVSCMSFSKPRFSKKTDWEIVRLATKLDHNVVGGFSKMLKFFRQHFTGSILTYSDNRYGTGEVYSKNGGQLAHITKPGYFWTDGTRVLSRYATQKSKLSKLLKTYDETLTEQENMFANKWRIFYDCGNKVFIFT